MTVTSQVSHNDIYSHRLANGMILVGEPNSTVQSAAITLLVPSGYTTDPTDRLGLSSLVCDMVLRGAGSRDSRALINDLEILGVERGESVGASQISFSAATLSENLDEALSIYSDIIRRPHLPADQIEAGQQVCLQEINGINDEIATALYSVCNRQDTAKLIHIDQLVQMGSADRSITVDEATMLREILEIAHSGDWKKATVEARRLMTDQVKYP